MRVLLDRFRRVFDAKPRIDGGATWIFSHACSTATGPVAFRELGNQGPVEFDSWLYVTPGRFRGSADGQRAFLPMRNLT